jgi:RND superfamily putative drug exporter
MIARALYRIGRHSASRPWTVLAAWLVVAAVTLGLSATVGRSLSDAFDAPGLDSTKATELLTKAGADEAGLTAQVVATPADRRATFESADARAALDRLRVTLAGLPNVLATSDPAVSPNGRVAVVRLQYPVVEQLSRADLARLERTVEHARVGSPLRLEMGGDLFFAFEDAQTGYGEVLGLVAAVIVLLLAFGSVVAMGLPIVTALFSLAIGVGSLSLAAYLLDVPTWAPVIGSMVGLGVGIDYALFIVSRHRENLAAGHDVAESVGRALATAGRSVLFAGGTVVISILGLAVAGVRS